MKDEKYISIKFEKWENYYKPLEEKYKKLEKELQDEKVKKQLQIIVKLDSDIIKDYNVYHNVHYNLYIPEFFHNNIDNLIKQLPDVIKQNIISNYISFKRKNWFSRLFS